MLSFVPEPAARRRKFACFVGLCEASRMSLAQAEEAPLSPEKAASKAAPGGLVFAPAARQADVCAELRARRYLVVATSPVTPLPGGLRRAIDDAVEGTLALRGALPPAVEIDAGAEITARDQFFRARALGAQGLSIALPRLPCPPGQRLLDPEDGAALSAWIAAAQRTSVVLVLDEADRDVQLLIPRRLGDLTSGKRTGVTPVPPPVALAATPMPPPVRVAEPAPAPVPDSTIPPSGEVEKAIAHAATDEDPPTQRTPRPPPPILAMPRRGVMKKRPRPEPIAAPADSALAEAASDDMTPPPIAPAVIALAAIAPSAPMREEPAPAEAEKSAADQPAAQRVVNASEWRAHAVELDKARGPKPVSVIDKLFAARYMPLVGAIARGEVDAAVKAVVDVWRTNFEHSYREAFAALRVTGKRPPMVFDAPDIAARIGRLNGARAVKLLLVDAMRFDLGERVGARLTAALAGRAVCVDRPLLWAALPTNTPAQAALLARGPEGLRDAETPSEPDAEIIRGRAVSTLRRERYGSREAMKLDLVEARLRNAGPGYEERMDSIADEVAPIVVRYVESLPPRTLLFIFGDHGFRLPASPDGRLTGPASQGGVSPEEVLVPGQAWLIGGVH
jgi:hypothetical protein